MSTADFRRKVLGKLEVLRDTAKADELDASRKVQELIGARFDAKDAKQLDDLQAAVSRHRGYAAATVALDEAIEEVQNVRLE